VTRNYYWRQNPNATAYIQASEGLFIGEIVQRLEQVINHNMTQRYVHVFAHDGDVGPLAGALGINLLRWPAMASNVAFEIWYFKLPSHWNKIYGLIFANFRQTAAPNSTYYARVLYSGQPIETIHGVLNWIPLQSLVNILQPYVPSNVSALCSTGIAN